MSEFDLSFADGKPIEPLIGREQSLEAAADTMLAASRTMLSAAVSLSAALGGPTARDRELTAEAVEAGVFRALRREALLTGPEVAGMSASALRLPGGTAGTGYGRMGASVTGKGARSQLYGSIGGAIGYAVGGPVGAVVGGMLGGWLGGGDGGERRQEEQRQWLNTPEGFEIQAYLYQLSRAYAATRESGWQRGGLFGIAAPWAWAGPGSGFGAGQVIVSMSPGAVQITGQGEEAGAQAARAFAGALGRALRLNSVVVPAAGLGGDL